MRPTLVKGGLPASLVALAFVAVAAPAVGSSQLPASFYPQPIPAAGGAAFSACPNPAGLERFKSASTQVAEHVAETYGHVSLSDDLRNSDRSFWPMLRKAWRQADGDEWLSFSDVRGSQLGGPMMFWSGVVRHYCGAELVVDSLSVDVTRRTLENCDCNGVSLLFIDRRGRPLVYMVH